MIKKLFFLCALCCVCVSAFSVSLIVEKGNLKLELYEDTGSFSVFYRESAGKPYSALFTPYNHANSSYSSLRSDDKIVKLLPSSQVRVAALMMPSGNPRFEYTVKGDVKVFIDFTFCASVENTPEDSLQIDVWVINASKMQRFFSFKSLFDTYLGEVSNRHFSTMARESVNTETVFQSFVQDRWIISSNGLVSLALVLNGTGITPVQRVMLANRAILTSTAWQPGYSVGRAFSSVTSINDSAVEIIWPAEELAFNTFSHLRFYLSAAGSGKKPPSLFPPADSNDSIAVKKLEYTDANGKQAFAISSSAFRLDRAYVQSIMRRIEELERNPSATDPQEISRLNKTLDSLLELTKGGR